MCRRRTTLNTITQGSCGHKGAPCLASESVRAAPTGYGRSAYGDPQARTASRRPVRCLYMHFTKTVSYTYGFLRSGDQNHIKNP